MVTFEMFAKKSDIVLVLLFTHVYHCQRRIQDGRVLPDNVDKPYVVYLVRAAIESKEYDSWLCGGAIVSSDFVLTSAACIKDIGHAYVIAGYKKYVRDDEIELDDCSRNMKKRVIYSCYPDYYDYQYDKLNKWSNVDIGIAKTDTPFNFDDEKYTQYCSYKPSTIPINYELRYQEPNTDAVVLGWGHRYIYRKDKDRDNHNQEFLNWAPVLIMDKETCKNEYGIYENMSIVIDQYMICTKEAGALNAKGEVIENDPKNKVKIMDCGTTNPYSLKYIERCDDENNPFAVDETRRIFNQTQSNKTTEKKDDSVGTYDTRRFGICQNDHGSPIVTWVGTHEVLIGVASVFKVTEELNCSGPYLYTSTTCNGAFIDCILHKVDWIVGKDNTTRRSTCRKAGAEKGIDTIERHIQWLYQPDGPAEYDMHDTLGKNVPERKLEHKKKQLKPPEIKATINHSTTTSDLNKQNRKWHIAHDNFETIESPKLNEQHLNNERNTENKMYTPFINYPEYKPPIQNQRYSEIKQPIIDQRYPDLNRNIPREGDNENEQYILTQIFPENEHLISRQGYPDNDRPLINERYPQNGIKPPINQWYPENGNPIHSLRYPGNEQSILSQRYPENDRPIVSQRYPENDRPIVSQRYPEKDRPIVSQRYQEYLQPGPNHPENLQPGPRFPHDDQPGQRYPDNIQAGQRYPDFVQPGQRYPDSVQLGQRFPDNEQPGQRYPDNLQPGQKYPDNIQPSQRYPDNLQPGQTYPDNVQPGQRYPDNIHPGQRNPDNEQPGQRNPDNEQPGHRYPDNLQPGQIYPDNVQPGHRYPDNLQPGQRYPDNVQPGQKYPDNVQPGQRYPDNVQPGQRYPENVQPGQRYPDHVPPRQSYPDNEQPGQRYPENGQSALGETYPINDRPIPRQRYTENDNPINNQRQLEYPPPVLLNQMYPKNEQPKSILSQSYPGNDKPVPKGRYTENEQPNEKYPFYERPPFDERQSFNQTYAQKVNNEYRPINGRYAANEKYTHIPNIMHQSYDKHVPNIKYTVNDRHVPYQYAVNHNRYAPNERDTTSYKYVPHDKYAANYQYAANNRYTTKYNFGPNEKTTTRFNYISQGLPGIDNNDKYRLNNRYVTHGAHPTKSAFTLGIRRPQLPIHK